MSYATRGRTNIYRALAAEAIEKNGERKMVDFKALAAKRKAEMEEKKKNLTPLPVSRPIPGENINKEASIIDNLDEIIDSDYSSNWEKNFCKSVQAWLLRDPTNTMSYKQKAVYDKLVKGILERPDTTSAVPTVDNSKVPYKRYEDRDYRAPYDNYLSAPARKSSVFDDMDDDIPF